MGLGYWTSSPGRRAGSIAGALLGVSLGLAASVGLGMIGQATGRGRALADSGGRILSVLLQYDPAAGDMVAPAYRDMLGALSAETQVLVAVEERAHLVDLEERLGRGHERPRLEAVVIGQPITTWSRDRFLSAAREGPVLVVPRQAPSPLLSRANDWVVPWTVAREREDVHALQAPFVFEGGDFVADEERIYATAVVLGRNRESRYGEADALRSSLAALTGLEPVLVGESVEDVPSHHIGMFVTPIGGGRVLVGDARLGAALVEERSVPAGLEPDRSEATAARFDLVADELARAGVEVIRIPLVPTVSELVYLSWNNVIVDDRDGERHVLLPLYGFPALDSAGRAVWRDLGFAVHPVDVASLYVHGGAVRCLAAVLARR